jgi:hypothetical protein
MTKGFHRGYFFLADQLNRAKYEDPTAHAGCLTPAGPRVAAQA